MGFRLYDILPRLKDRVDRIIGLLPPGFFALFRSLGVSVHGLWARGRTSRAAVFLAAVLGAYLVLYAVFGVFLFNENRSAAYRAVAGTIFYPLNRIFGRNAGEGRDLSVLPLKVAKAEEREVYPRISSIGTIDFYDKVDIAPRTNGRIEKLYVKEGDVVRKGQRICDLERIFLELDLQQQAAAVAAARSDLDLQLEKYSLARKGVEGRFREIEKQVSVNVFRKAADSGMSTIRLM